MRGRIRYFFWSTAFSAALLIYSTMTGGLVKTIHTIQNVKQEGAAGLPVAIREKIPLFFHEYLPAVLKRKISPQIWANIDRLGRNGHYDRDDYKEAERNEVATESSLPGGNVLTSDDSSSQASVAPSANKVGALNSKAPVPDSKVATREDMDTGQYVEIDGRYYKKRADNVYYVSNQKIFFQNNHRYAGGEKWDSEGNIITDVSSGGRGADNSGSERGASAENDSLPASPDDMMKTIKRAEENQRQQAEQLKQLEKENYR